MQSMTCGSGRDARWAVHGTHSISWRECTKGYEPLRQKVMMHSGRAAERAAADGTTSDLRASDIKANVLLATVE